MTDLQKNLILYLADFFSMQEQNIPVTDTCKYFFINRAPLNIQYIATGNIDIDFDNPYVKNSILTLKMLNNNLTEKDAISFVTNLCEIQASGIVDGYRMLQFIYQYDEKMKKKALRTYRKHTKNQTFTHKVKDDDGEEIEVECSKYIAHADRMC